MYYLYLLFLNAGFQVTFPSTPTKSQQNVNFVKKGLLSPVRLMAEETTTNISEKEVESGPEIELVDIRNEEDNTELVIENNPEKEAENRDVVSKTSMLRKVSYSLYYLTLDISFNSVLILSFNVETAINYPVVAALYIVFVEYIM